jgi:uncharacterized phage protein gp47/JayE
MPEAIAIEVFRLYGVKRSLGTKATGQLTFLLTDEAIDPFVLPAGYTLPYLDSNLVITESLVISPGAQEGTVASQVADIGSRYNAKPFDILVTTTGLGRVQSVFNRQQLTGGSDIESLESLVKRCQASTVSRNAVITATDYELAAQAVLGDGSRAVAAPNLAADGYTYQQYSVVVFLLDSTGKPASTTTCQQVAAELKSKILIGSNVACLPVVLKPIDVIITLNVRELSEGVALEVIEGIRSYLNPVTYDGGDVILHNELVYVSRLVRGVRSVDSVLLNGDAIDYQLEQPWHFPVAGYITVEQVDSKGLTLSTSASFGDDDYLILDRG